MILVNHGLSVVKLHQLTILYLFFTKQKKSTKRRIKGSETNSIADSSNENVSS
jgi:hypothetical protein